jgi:hypothetical protein
MAAHTYWRLFFTATPYGNRAVIDLLQFYDSTSTLIPTTGGTAFAGTTQSGSSAGNAFSGGLDNNWWISNSTSITVSTPDWLGYQFASAVDVSYFILSPRQDTTFGQQWPCDIALQYSDDGTTWTTLYQYYGCFCPGNGGGTTLQWTCNASNAAPVLGIAYRLLITATQGTTIASIVELKLYNSGGTQITTGCIAAPSSSVTGNEGDGGYGAFDGNTATYWASNGTPSSGSPEWLAYWFGSGTPTVGSFSVKCRSLTYNQAPTAFSLQSSPDGSTWTTIQSFTAATWGSSSETQTFTITPPATIALSPSSGAQNTSVTVTVTGTNTHFVSGTTAVSVSGSGVTAGTVTVASGTSLTAVLTITATAATGSRTMTVTTGSEAPTASFSITAGVFQRGHIDYDQIRSVARQGTGAQFQMYTGQAPVSGHIAVYDASGNLTDGGTGGGASYVLPPATATLLGGVKIGENVNVAADGTISVANSVISVNGVLAGNVTNGPITVNGIQA